MRDSQIILEGTHVFSKQGPKIIGGVANDLLIKIETLREGTIEFKSNPFSFTIGNPNKNVYNSVSNNTSINVEAERVVGTFDASKTGASQNTPNETTSHRWKTLKLIPLIKDQSSSTSHLKQLSATIAPLESAAEPVQTSQEVATKESHHSDINKQSSQELINELLDKPNPLTHIDATETFVFALKVLSLISPLHQEKSVITALDLSLEIVQNITGKIEQLSHSEIAGMLINEPDSAFVDAHDYICGFDGAGYIFTTQGILTTSNGSESNDLTLNNWQEWSSKGIKPQIRKYNNNQFLIFIGDKAAQNLPGLSFDYRRYNGQAPLESIFQKLNDAYLWLVNNPIIQAEQNDTTDEENDELDEEAEVEYQSEEDDWSSPYSNDSVETAVIDLFKNLELMCIEGGYNAYKTCLKENITPHLIECFKDIDYSISTIGVIFDNTESLVLKDGLVDDYDGLAAVFGEKGIFTIASEGNGLSLEDYAFWSEFKSLNIQFYRYEDNNKYSFAFAPKGEDPIESTILDFTGINCNSTSTCGISVNTLAERCFEITEFISELTKDDDDVRIEINESIEETSEEEADDKEDEFIDHAQIALENKAIDKGAKFFSLFSYALQQCSDSYPKNIYIKSDISEQLITELNYAVGQSGTGLYALTIDNNQSTFTNDGKLTSWSGYGSMISAEGIFHMTRTPEGQYGLEGKNAFLSWYKIFNDYDAELQIRSEGPDIWFGTKDKILIRYSYCDYSNNIAQWDYFEDFVSKDLLLYFDEFRKCYC